MESRGGIMLVSFSIENVRCFNNEATLSMEATAVRSHPDSLLSSENRKLLPIAVIYGANASGKTTLVESLLLFTRKIVSGEHRTSFFPNLFCNTTKNSRIALEVSLDNYDFRYELETGLSHISSEKLQYKERAKNSYCLLYERTILGPNESNFNMKIGSGRFVDKGMSDEINYVSSMEKSENKLLLTALGKRGEITWFKRIYDWCSRTVTHSNSADRNYAISGITEDSLIYKFLDNDKSKLEYINFINKANPIINNIIVEKSKDVEGHGRFDAFYNVFFEYNSQIFLNNASLMSIFESQGTRKALRIFPAIYQVLQNGGLLIVDELESSLHPLLVVEVINLFTSQDTNPGGGQLIFTCHNPIIMESKYFRRDEIWFVEKDEKGCSELYCLHDIEGVRNDTDFCKNYILGCFGGVPEHLFKEPGNGKD